MFKIFKTHYTNILVATVLQQVFGTIYYIPGNPIADRRTDILNIDPNTFQAKPLYFIISILSSFFIAWGLTIVLKKLNIIKIRKSIIISILLSFAFIIIPSLSHFLWAEINIELWVIDYLLFESIRFAIAGLTIMMIPHKKNKDIT